MAHSIQQMAQAFVGWGKKLKHPTVELVFPLGAPNEYRLHGNVIARQDSQHGVITFDWCGWYTPTTANHINEILKAAGCPRRVSYTQAKRQGIKTFSSRDIEQLEVEA